MIDGRTKTTYNHGGSRPDDLGLGVLNWLHSAVADLGGLRRQAADLRVVERETVPTGADIEYLTKYARPSSSLESWQGLLSGTAGDPAAILNAGVIVDSSGFPADSLSAEWGYVIDVDEEVFEVYRGFQTRPHDSGRFAAMQPIAPYSTPAARRYYPVAMRARWPLSNLPDEATFLVTCGTVPKPEPLVPESFDAAGCMRTTVTQFVLAPDDPNRASISPADATAIADDVARLLGSASEPAEAAWLLGQELAADSAASPRDSVRRRAVGLMLYNLQVHAIGLTDLFPDVQQSAADGATGKLDLPQRLELVRQALTTWRAGDHKGTLGLMELDLACSGPDAVFPNTDPEAVDALYAAYHITICEAEPPQVQAAAQRLLSTMEDLLGLAG